MAWSWSHAADAYANARDNLEELPREDLNVIYAEWEAAKDLHGQVDANHTPFDERRYAEALASADQLDTATLLDCIWVYTEAFATCDNGGYNAWVCPYGCHTVPFSPA